MKGRIALAAEVSSGEELERCVQILRDLGLSRFDAYTPYQVEGLQELLGVPRSRLAWIVFAAGMVGAGAAYLLQWWINVVDYPLNIGGRPYHSAPAFIPITFEMGVLFAASAALISAIVLGRMPSLWHPVFELEGFGSATDDRFWLAVGADDAALDRATATAALEAAGAVRVIWVEDAR